MKNDVILVEPGNQVNTKSKKYHKFKNYLMYNNNTNECLLGTLVIQKGNKNKLVCNKIKKKDLNVLSKGKKSVSYEVVNTTFFDAKMLPGNISTIIITTIENIPYKPRKKRLVKQKSSNTNSNQQCSVNTTSTSNNNHQGQITNSSQQGLQNGNNPVNSQVNVASSQQNPNATFTKESGVEMTKDELIEVINDAIDKKLDEKLDAILDKKLDEKFDAKFKEFEAKMEALIDKKIDEKLEVKFKEFEAKMEVLIDRKIDEKLDKKLDEKLAPIIARIDKIEEDIREIKERLTKLEKQVAINTKNIDLIMEKLGMEKPNHED